MTTKVTGSVLADTAVTAGNYGGTTTLQTVSVDAQGRITYAANLTSGVITAGTIGQAADIIVPTIRYNALGQIVAATNNTIRIANTVVTGVVQLADSVSNTSTTAAATASAVKAAYDAAGANASTALSSAQANTGAGLISAKTISEANVGAGLISTKSAYEGNVGAGLITVTNNYQANVGAVNIGLNNEITNRQANVGAAAISSTSASNLSSGTVPSGRLSGAYSGITGVGTLATGSIPGSLISSVVANATTATNGAKAWVNFNGTTGTRNASYNVDSVTVNATGDYTINFTSGALTSNPYGVAGITRAVGASQSGYGATVAISGAHTPSATSLRVWTMLHQASSVTVDVHYLQHTDYVNVVVFQ